jgi:hypothetical protein
VSEEQLSWLKEGLQSANNAEQTEGLLIHSFPSGLKAGGSEVMKVIRKFNVRLIEMEHTHRNEIPNDGRTLYSSTRWAGLDRTVLSGVRQRFHGAPTSVTKPHH